MQIRYGVPEGDGGMGMESIKGYLKNLFSPPKNNSQYPDILHPMAGALSGIGTGQASEMTGLETELHEYGHKEAAKLVYNFSPGKSPQITNYQFDNVRNFLSNPNPDSFNKIVTMYTPQKNVGGYTSWTTSGGLTPVGEALGENGSAALVEIAGPLVNGTLPLIEFAAGFKLRKKHPLLGYNLMAMSIFPYLNMANYALTPLTMPGTWGGNDFSAFSNSTGISPVVPAAAFGAGLPALAIALFAYQHHKEGLLRDRLALTRLIGEGKISQDKLLKSFQSYDGKEKIEGLEDKVEAFIEKGQAKEADKAAVRLMQEYNRFSDHLIKQNQADVDEEKKVLFAKPKLNWESHFKNFVGDLKKSYGKDKVGAVLSASGTSATVGSSALQTAEAAAPQALHAASGVLGAAVPFAGILGTAAVAYRAARAAKNKAVSRLDKATQASLAAFSSVSTAGLIIPVLGLPLTLIGLAGIGGTYLLRFLASKV